MHCACIRQGTYQVTFLLWNFLLMSTLRDQAVGHLNLSEDAMKMAFVILALRNS